MRIGRRSRALMPLLVDVYNVLHVVGVLPPELAGPDLRGLARLIAASRWGRESVLMVCDGRRPPESDPTPLPSGFRVRYSGPGRTADDLIRSEIERSTAPRRLLVVSSDNEIDRAARRRRCETMRSEQFLARLVQDLERSRPNAPAPPASGPTEIPEDLRREALALEEAWTANPPADDDATPPPAPPDEETPADELEDAREGPTVPVILPPELLAEAARLINAAPAPPTRTPVEPAPPPEPQAPPDAATPMDPGLVEMVREAMELAHDSRPPARAKQTDARRGRSEPTTGDSPGSESQGRREEPWIPDDVMREAEDMLARPDDDSAPDAERRRSP